MTTKELKNKLEAIAKQEHTIEGFIAYDSLAYDTNDCTAYIRAIIDPRHSMGMAITFMQSDVDDFYATHIDDIHKKKKEYGVTDNDLAEFVGDPISNLCWIVVEETAIRMAKELGIEA